jgi:hypothetical protein
MEAHVAKKIAAALYLVPFAQKISAGMVLPETHMTAVAQPNRNANSTAILAPNMLPELTAASLLVVNIKIARLGIPSILPSVLVNFNFSAGLHVNLGCGPTTIAVNVFSLVKAVM